MIDIARGNFELSKSAFVVMSGSTLYAGLRLLLKQLRSSVAEELSVSLHLSLGPRVLGLQDGSHT